MKPAIVTLLPVAPFLVEVRSERIVDLCFALEQAGFVVNAVPNHVNRLSVEDAKELDPCQQQQPK